MGQDFTTTFTVDQTPDEVFTAINNVRGWWAGDGGDVEGGTDRVGDEFTYRYKDIHYSKQKITELVPGAKVVWRVLDANLSFTRDPAEWTGTNITFDISRNGRQTDVTFTHRGLVPEVECFDQCSNAWSYLVNSSLRELITSGAPADGGMR